MGDVQQGRVARLIEFFEQAANEASGEASTQPLRQKESNASVARRAAQVRAQRGTEKDQAPPVEQSPLQSSPEIRRRAWVATKTAITTGQAAIETNDQARQSALWDQTISTLQSTIAELDRVSQPNEDDKRLLRNAQTLLRASEAIRDIQTARGPKTTKSNVFSESFTWSRGLNAADAQEGPPPTTPLQIIARAKERIDRARDMGNLAQKTSEYDSTKRALQIASWGQVLGGVRAAIEDLDNLPAEHKTDEVRALRKEAKLMETWGVEISREQERRASAANILGLTDKLAKEKQDSMG